MDHDYFRRIAKTVSNWSGSPWAFALASVTVIVWALTGPVFRYSDTWQLVINTGTTIITFLMVFLIQNTQNRDARILHLKIDELIRVNSEARNALIELDQLSDEELNHLHDEFCSLMKTAESRLKAIEASKQKKRAKKP